MNRYHLEIRVTPRPGILDPEGKVIHHALESLGYAGTRDVRVGKAIYVELDAAGEDEARTLADEMSRKLLANPVTEDYEIRFVDHAAAGAAAGEGGDGA